MAIRKGKKFLAIEKSKPLFPALLKCSIQMEKAVAAFLSLFASSALTLWTTSYQPFSLFHWNSPWHKYLSFAYILKKRLQKTKMWPKECRIWSIILSRFCMSFTVSHIYRGLLYDISYNKASFSALPTNGFQIFFLSQLVSTNSCLLMHSICAWVNGLKY